jgi:hydroxymethylglutaryl-CoA lyase
MSEVFHLSKIGFNYLVEKLMTNFNNYNSINYFYAMLNQPIKLIECPRDAMQGWGHMIATDQKVKYIQSLLDVGFDTIDFGSFVSPKAIPQMADTKEVIQQLDLSNTTSKLLAIIANKRGADAAIEFEQIKYLGFPFSVSETFQIRNTNSTIQQAFNEVEQIQKICLNNKKELVVYISMGFGNPYGDEYNEEIVFNWVNKIKQIGVKIISLADTVGVASPDQIYRVIQFLVIQLPDIEIGAHLHSTQINWQEKLDAALSAGCRRIDGAIKGIGGCPMAGNELVGNMNTELMLSHIDATLLSQPINQKAFQASVELANQIFI